MAWRFGEGSDWDRGYGSFLATHRLLKIGSPEQRQVFPDMNSCTPPEDDKADPGIKRSPYVMTSQNQGELCL